jgi:hypothetical protein
MILKQWIAAQFDVLSRKNPWGLSETKKAIRICSPWAENRNQGRLYYEQNSTMKFGPIVYQQVRQLQSAGCHWMISWI